MKNIVEYIKNLLSKIFGKQEIKLLEKGITSNDEKTTSIETEKRDFLSGISLHSYLEEESLLKEVEKSPNTIAFMNERQLEMLDRVTERKMSELRQQQN